MIRHQWITTTGTFDLTDPGGSAPYSRVFLANKGIEGMGNPPIQRYGDESPLLDGQVDRGWRARPRPVFWPVVIDVDSDSYSWQSQQRVWWRTMRPNVTGTWRVTAPDLTYRDLVVRYINDGGAAYATDPSLTDIEVHGIELVAEDPWWRGPVVSKSFQTAEDSLPFYAVTTDRVFNLMSSNTVANASLTNPGDVSAWPMFRFDGPITSFTIGQYDGGTEIQATYDVPAGDWLILDTDPRVQTMTHYYSGGGSTDVTDELDNAFFFGIQPSGASTSFYVTLNGAGSMTASIIPRYFRAF